jgi:hypothetical protein
MPLVTDTLEGKINELQELKLKVTKLEKEVTTLVKENKEIKDLIYFYGDGCQFTKKADPSVACLERFLRAPISRREVWHNEDNHVIWKEHGGESNCGGVPYFYNKLTGKSVCGAANCEILKEWAKR